MKKITFLLCMLSLIFAGSLIGCSEAQNNPSNTQIPNDVAGAKGPKSVDLGTSGDYAILAKSAISTATASDITGDIGLSPLATSLITGFDLTGVNTAEYYASSTQVSGKVYAADMVGINPATNTKTSDNLTTAVSDMKTAYTDAAERMDPDFTDLGTGNIGGMTLAPGLYKWGAAVSIPTNITLEGGSDDVWIFQSVGITVASGVKVILTGEALPENIFWQSSDQVTIGTFAQFEGIILSSTGITMNTGSTIKGRLLAQTAVTLNQSTVTQPVSTL